MSKDKYKGNRNYKKVDKNKRRVKGKIRYTNK